MRRHGFSVVGMLVVVCVGVLFGLMQTSVQADPIGEAEPNDTIGSAQVLADIGAANPVNAAIDEVNDEDWFAFAATAGQRYVVELYNVDSSLGLDSARGCDGGTRGGLWLSIADPSEDEIARQCETNGDGSVHIFYEFLPSTSGTHSIFVRAYASNVSGNYRLRVLPQFNDPAASWDANTFEPNNRAINAFAIQPGHLNAITANIEQRDGSSLTRSADVDWYRFEAVAGTRYTIELFDVASSLVNDAARGCDGGTRSGLWFSIANPLRSEVVRQCDINGGGGGNVHSFAEFQPEVTGTHYIQVTSYSESVFGSYSLRILPQFNDPAASWDANTFEPNNRAINAFLIVPGSANALTSSIEERNPNVSTTGVDIDWYRFVAQGGEEYTIELFDVAASLSSDEARGCDGGTRAGLWLAISDLARNEIQRQCVSNGREDVQIFTTFQPAVSGIYYVFVRPYADNVFGSYGIRVIGPAVGITPTPTAEPATPTPTSAAGTPTSTPTESPAVTPTPTASSGTPSISLSISSNAIEPGERFEISVNTTGTPGGTGIEFALAYDNTIVECSTGFPGDDMPVIPPGNINVERSVCEAAPGRYEWVSTLSVPATGYPAGELARVRFNAANVDTSTTISIVPGSVRLADRDGNSLPITIGTGDLTLSISAATIDGTVTCQVPGNPMRQARIFASANNGTGTSIFTLSTSGSPYSLNASTTGNPWSVIAACNCHINGQALNVNSPSTNNNFTLPAGDVVGVQADRDNGEINIRDIIAIAARLGGPTDSLACADLNQDGTVNVQDITVARGNFGVREFLPPSTSGTDEGAAPSDLAQDAATVTCRVEPVAGTSNAELIVEVANVTDLYGYSFDLTHDSNLVQVDGAPWSPTSGLLNPELTVNNTASSTLLSLAVTQQNPSTPVSGSGELARATLRPGAEAGTHTFAFNDVILANRDGGFIAAQASGTCTFTSNGDGIEPVRIYIPLLRR